jgi:hypothetical protein
MYRDKPTPELASVARLAESLSKNAVWPMD